MSVTRIDLRQRAQLAIAQGKKGMMHSPDVMLELLDAADIGAAAVAENELLKEQIADLRELVKEGEEAIKNLKAEGKLGEVLAELNAAWAERDEWKAKLVAIQAKFIKQIRELNARIEELVARDCGDVEEPAGQTGGVA